MHEQMTEHGAFLNHDLHNYLMFNFINFIIPEKIKEHILDLLDNIY